jgi:uncharacterized membrane protein (UPF0182 family)
LRGKFSFGKIVFSLLLLFIFVKVTSGFYVSYQWFKDLGYTQLFMTPIIAKLEIGVIAFVIYLILLFLISFIAFRVYEKAEREEFELHPRFTLNGEPINITPLNKKRIMKLILIISIVISFFLALIATGNGWSKLLEYRNAFSFNLQDTVFHKDISFYVFKIPLYNFVLNSLYSSFILIFIFSTVVFTLTGMVRIQGNLFKKNSLHIPSSIRKYWAAFLGIIFTLMALKNILSMYAIMYSQNGYVYGAGFTDIHVTIPLSIILAITALWAVVGCGIFFNRNNARYIVITFLAYVGLNVLGGIVTGLVQYTVSNNEFFLEKPYIEQEIKFTRQAYNLDTITVKDYPGNAKLTQENIKNNQETISNIRLNDPDPLKTVLSQNQGLRYYYRFHNIDMDRYTLDGKYRQVLLSGRELSESALTEKAGTFVNLTMRYTHGYGIAATLANEIDASGYANLVVRDIPPQSDKKGIEVKEPRIYYGELTNDERYGYVIGNTSAKEFDYPLGDNNAENIYQGSTGLKLSPVNKLFLSAYYNTLRLYIAQEINPDSKLLMNRNILSRVQTLMPYLKYDENPYLVVGSDGKLYWMIDAYTSTDKYPYSAPTGDINYIRNSAKVIVDAYNGTVSFYNFGPKDPIMQTLSKIYPDVFKNPKEMPANLIEHIRYPEDLFNIQSNVLLNFHVKNPSVFYNREDTWDIAKKVSAGNTQNINPYYSIMKLPGEEKAEYILMLPFTPASRQEQHRNNLLAWLAAQNDGENYGKLTLYRMPKNVEIQGPLMIDSMIDQDTVISQKLALWEQGGSSVIRGNLLAIPIDGGLVYVEPIYIKADRQGTSIPQMQAIVFAIDQKLVLVETKSLDKAIAKFFEGEGLTTDQTTDKTLNNSSNPTVKTPTLPTDKPGREQLLNQIRALKKQIEAIESSVEKL